MQTTYDEKMDVAVVGQLVDCTNRRVDSKYAEAAIEAGDAVDIGTADDQVVKAVSAVYGVAIQHPTLTMSDDTGLASYEQYDGVSVLRQGRIWVQVGLAVAIDDSAYWDDVAGTFSNTDATGANPPVTGGRFVTSTSGAGLAILEIS